MRKLTKLLIILAIMATPVQAADREIAIERALTCNQNEDLLPENMREAYTQLKSMGFDVHIACFENGKRIRPTVIGKETNQ